MIIIVTTSNTKILSQYCQISLSSFALFSSCFTENQLLYCSYKDPAFKEKCKEEYLEERSEYRRTGIKKKMKKKDAVIS